MFKIGDRVTHPQFGVGIVEKSHDGGRILDVRFERHRGFTIPMRRQSLALRGSAAIPVVPPKLVVTTVAQAMGK